MNFSADLQVELDICSPTVAVRDIGIVEGKYNLSSAKEELNYQDLHPLTNKYDSSWKHIQNTKVNSSFEEMVTLGYKFVTNNVNDTFMEMEETILTDVLYGGDINSSVENSQPVCNQANSTEWKTTKKPKVVNTFKALPTIKTKRVKMISVIKPRINRLGRGVNEKDSKNLTDSSSISSEPFNCYLCSYTTQRDSTLKLHLAFEHNETEAHTESIKPVNEEIPIKNLSHKIKQNKNRNKPIIHSSKVKLSRQHKSILKTYNDSHVIKSLKNTNDSKKVTSSTMRLSQVAPMKCDKSKTVLPVKVSCPSRCEKVSFSCFYCGYTSLTRPGIKIHIRKKHHALFTKRSLTKKIIIRGDCIKHVCTNRVKMQVDAGS